MVQSDGSEKVALAAATTLKRLIANASAVQQLSGPLPAAHDGQLNRREELIPHYCQGCQWHRLDDCNRDVRCSAGSIGCVASPQYVASWQ